MKKLILFVAAFYLTVLASSGSYAAPASGGGSNSDCISTKVDDTIDLAKRKLNQEDMALALLNFLEKNIQRVAVVARAGSDLSNRDFRNPSAQKYTHVGLVVKNYKNSGAWRFVHLLNTCSGPTSDIFVQNLQTFFSDDPYYYDVKIGSPTPQLQEAIAKVLENEVLYKGFHNNQYSNIAHPNSLKYQNSNMWVLTAIAAAQSGLVKQQQIQDYYLKQGFIPSEVKIGFFEKLGVGLGFGGKNVHLDDHLQDEQATRWFKFVSADSVFDYLVKTDQLLNYGEICHNSKCNTPVSALDAK